MKRAFVAFDRDGTLIVEKNYLADPAGVELLPGARQALDQLRSRGYGLLVVTNQSGVGRGYFGMDVVDAIHARLIELLGPFDGIYICPHTPEEGCDCRKPKPGLLLQAAREHGFDLAECVVVGDKPADVDLARNAGAPSILVRTGYGAETLASGQAKPDCAAADLTEAAAWILARAGK